MLSSRSSNVLARRFSASVGKQIVRGQYARSQILKGCDILADAVGCTLGPKGRNVLIEQTYGGPKITKDGVTVAKAIELENKIENLGASLIKQVASNTNDTAGDGTTTATILAREIYRGGCQAVAAGLNPMEVLNGIKIATDEVNNYLLQHSRQVSTKEEIFHVACVSANGDKKIGQLIADAMERVGKDGTINVTEGKTLEHQLTFVDGYEFDRGFVSPYFSTDPATMKCVLDNNPLILISEDKISNIQQILPILESIARSNEELLIIAEDIDSEVIAALVLNRLRGGLNVCAVKAPGFGENRRSQLEDIAILTGGIIAHGERGTKLENLTVKDLGRVRRAQIARDTCLLVEGNGNPKKVQEQILKIKNQMKNYGDLSEYEKSKLQERLGKLIGGVAVIQVGGGSEFEVGEIKDRLDDALNATKAAVDNGILPGGGSAFLYASEYLKDRIKGKTKDEQAGINLLLNAIRKPIRMIAKNAGYDSSNIIGDLLRKDKKIGCGFDVMSGEYVDMYDRGIVDPTKVVLTSIQDAASVASLLCTTETAIISSPNESSKKDIQDDF